MEQSPKTIPLRPTPHAVLAADARPAPMLPLSEPATAVMTDLDRTPMVTVDAETQIDDALRLMKHAGVRSAIVVDERGGLLGLVTAYDILGDAPVRLIESGGGDLRGRGRAAVSVAAIMEPVARWQAIDLHDLQRSTVADVVETFRRTGRTHIVVVEAQSGSTDRLRGLLSATEVARRTGTETSGLPAAATFAEIERAVL